MTKTQKIIFSIFIVLMAIVLIVGIVIFFSLASHIWDSVKKPEGKEPSITFVQEESFFVDYRIIDDSIVEFKYSLCLRNNDYRDIRVRLSAKFNEKELDGWVECQDYFKGYDEDGDLAYRLVESQEKVNLIYIFRGKYLGGSVNEQLSFPVDITLLFNIAN